MKALIGRIIFRLLGWSIDDHIPKDLKKYVLIAVPHTSNMDFFLSLPSMWIAGIKGKYLIKKEAFNAFTGPILRATGGVPVDRSVDNTEFVETLKKMLEERDEFTILFTPEGTRSAVKKWKTGFYRIALALDLPIVLAYADYVDKKVTVGDVFKPTGDFKQDFLFLEKYFENMRPRYPEKYNRKIFERD